MTAPQLLSLAYGKVTGGHFRCYYCGAECDESVPAAGHIKESFTGHAEVFAGRTANMRQRWHVCPGCVLAMQSDCVRPDYPKPQRWWTFSHVITKLTDRWLTKANLAELREICLRPPEPPSVIVLADSGQKHQIYFAPVNHGGDVVSVILETEVISYRPAELLPRLDLCARVAVAAGKPALSEPASISLGIALSGHWSDWEAILESWNAAHGQPLTRLAAWLTPGKETLGKDGRYVSNITASDSAPATRVRRDGVPKTARGPDGPASLGGPPGLFG